MILRVGNLQKSVSHGNLKETFGRKGNCKIVFNEEQKVAFVKYYD